MTTPGKTKTLIKCNRLSSSQGLTTTNGRHVGVAICAEIAEMDLTNARVNNANTVKSAEENASAVISVLPMTAT